MSHATGRRRAGARRHAGAAPAGVALIDVVAALGVASVLAAITVPALASARDRFQAAAAARHVAAMVRQTQSDAALGGRTAALRFAVREGRVTIGRFVDGNRNGVRTDDIARNVDTRTGPEVTLEEHFAGTSVGLVPGVTDIDTGAPLSGSGVRVGAAGLLSFSPSGSSTSGTLYVRGQGTTQYAVRVLGGTGRIRLLRFQPEARTWGLP